MTAEFVRSAVGPQQFPVELQIGDVTNLIPCGEGRVRHSLDERVQFRL